MPTSAAAPTPRPTMCAHVFLPHLCSGKREINTCFRAAAAADTAAAPAARVDIAPGAAHAAPHAQHATTAASDFFVVVVVDDDSSGTRATSAHSPAAGCPASA